MNVHLIRITQHIGLLIQWRMSTSHWRSWEAHGRYNDPFVSKPNAFLDFFQSLGQLQKFIASISGLPTQNCQLQHMNWINWTLLSCACSRITAAGTCSNSRWGTVSKADDQWIDTRMYWCPASVGCIIIGMNFLGIFELPHGWMWLVWAVDRMWYCGC